MSDAKGLTKNIAARLADLCEGTEDSFAPKGMHQQQNEPLDSERNRSNT